MGTFRDKKIKLRSLTTQRTLGESLLRKRVYNINHPENKVYIKHNPTINPSNKS